MSKRHDCTNPAGHMYLHNGHVAKCQNSGCGKVRTYDPVTKTWKDSKK